MKTCSAPGCDRPFYAKGLCRTHRTRQLHSPFGLQPEVAIGYRGGHTHSMSDLHVITARVRHEAAWLTTVVLVGMANEVRT